MSLGLIESLNIYKVRNIFSFEGSPWNLDYDEKKKKKKKKRGLEL